MALMENITLGAFIIIALAIGFELFPISSDLTVSSNRPTLPDLLEELVNGRCGHLRKITYSLTSDKVVLPDGIKPATIHVRGSVIHAVELGRAAAGPRVIDYGDLVISPGLMDVHMHMNEPGRTLWEGVSTGTLAAAAGGITSVIDMPLNSIPSIVTPELVDQKLRYVLHKGRVDVGVWGGIVPGNAHNASLLQDMLNAGALGFKSFMSPSGVADFGNVSEANIRDAVAILRELGVPYYVHAEWVSPIEPEGEPNVYTTYMNTRPPSFEREAIRILIDALEAYTEPAKPGFRIHIAHLADAESLETIKAAKARGLPLTVETCPHYLTFSAESIPDNSTIHKCAPPIRSADNRDALIQAMAAKDGVIDLIASDHSPATPDLKAIETGDFLSAWGGISGAQYLLPATWTALKGQSGSEKLHLMRLTELLSSAPARLTQLQERKGTIVAGLDADFVVWNPNELANTSVVANRHRHKNSPFTDLPLWGKVEATYVRGCQVFSDKRGPSTDICGQKLIRTPATEK